MIRWVLRQWQTTTARSVPWWLLVLVASGCRAGEGEACDAETLCHPDLRCHRQTCKTPQQVAKLKMAENDARWAAKKREVYDTMESTKKELAKLKEKLAEAETDAERERLEKMVDELQKTNRSKPTSPPPVPAP